MCRLIYTPVSLPSPWCLLAKSYRGASNHGDAESLLCSKVQNIPDMVCLCSKVQNIPDIVLLCSKVQNIPDMVYPVVRSIIAEVLAESVQEFDGRFGTFDSQFCSRPLVPLSMCPTTLNYHPTPPSPIVHELHLRIYTHLTV